MINSAMAVIILAGFALWAAVLARRRFRKDLRSPENRARLWNRLYSWNWGQQSTNNYGYAPSELDHPEKYQLELYRALFAMSGGAKRNGAEILEVSCGRGGGLAQIVAEARGTIKATGLDLSGEALVVAQRLHGRERNIEFVRGSALDLPFPDSAFDIVLNVEASHEYGDMQGFFNEVRRVLRPEGLFLHCDSRMAGRVSTLFHRLNEAGFEGETRDITDNVVEACRIDSVRRAELLRQSVPWPERLLIGGWLRNYAALQGTRKLHQFSTGERRYFMSCLSVRTPRLDGSPAPIERRSRSNASCPEPSFAA